MAVVRTPAREAEGLVAWRSTVGTAFAIVLARPELWLIGALSIAARGGLLLLALPLLSLPSPVAFSVILGPDKVQANSQALQGMIAGAVAVVAVLAFAGLVVGAVADLMAYDRFVGDPESIDARGGREPRPLGRRRRFSTVVSLVGIQLTVLVPAIVAAVVLGERLSV